MIIHRLSYPKIPVSQRERHSSLGQILLCPESCVVTSWAGKSSRQIREQSKKSLEPRRVENCPCLLLVVYLLLALTSVSNKVSVYDEHAHICSGLSYLKSGNLSGRSRQSPPWPTGRSFFRLGFGVSNIRLSLTKTCFGFACPQYWWGLLLGLLIYHLVI